MKTLLLLASLFLCNLLVTTAQWQRTQAPEDGNIRELLVDGNVLIGTGFAGTFRSSDGGLTWSELESLRWARSASSIIRLGSGNYLLAGLDSLYRSTDRGLTWNALYSYKRTAANHLIEVGGALLLTIRGDGLYRSTDEGSTWTRISGDLTGTVPSIVEVGGALFAATSDQGIQRSTDNGATWHRANPDGPTIIRTLLAVADTIYAGLGTTGGSNYGAYVSRDAGATWYLLNKGLFSFNSVIDFAWFRGKLWGALQGGPAVWLRASDERWVGPGVAYATNTLAVSGDTMYIGTDTNGLYILGADDTVLTKRSIGLQAELTAFDYIPTSNGLLAITQNGFYESTDNGVTWQPTGLNVRSLFQKIFADFSLHRFNGRIYCTWKEGVLISSDEGATWEQSQGAINSYSTFGDFLQVGDTMLLVSTGNGIYRIAKDGITGTSYGVGAAAGRPTHALASFNGQLFAATSGNALMRSTDGGRVWSVAADGFEQSEATGLFVIAENLYATSFSRTYRYLQSENRWVPDSLGLEGGLSVAIRETAEVAGGIFVVIGRYDDAQREHGSAIYLSTNNGSSWADVGGPQIDSLDLRTLYPLDDYLLLSTYSYGTFRRAIQQMVSPSSVDPVRRVSAGVAIEIYPNPAGEMITVAVALPAAEQLRVVLYDALGRSVGSLFSGRLDAGSHRVGFNTSDLLPGVYYCRIDGERTMGGGSFVIR